MRDLVLARAKRILHTIPNYRPLSEMNNPETEGVINQLKETPIGIYQDMQSMDDDWVIVTDIGLHIHHGQQWISVRYNEIENIQNSDDKRQIAGLALQLCSNRSVYLPITGMAGKFRDRFEFLRFLDRVIEDIQQQH